MKLWVLLFVLMLGMAHAEPSVVDRFFGDYLFKFNPTQGTTSGFHQYDKLLEDYSRRNVDAQAKVLHSFEKEFLQQPDTPDRELILSKIHSDLLALEDIRMWEKNPDQYSSGVTESIFCIMSRNFAPQPVRLESVIAREQQIPAVFQAARANLKNPPHIYTQIALEQLPGIIGFFQKDVPLAFNEVKDKNLLGRFHQSNEAVIRSLESYQTFLKTDVLPRSHGDFRLGTRNFEKKLAYDEMVDIPLDRLLKIGFEDLRRNQQQFREVAAKIDPNKTPQQILADLEHDHPAPGKLLQTFRDVLGGLRSYVIDHKIVKVPSMVLPIVEETPPFMRALTFASMDTPGP